MDNTDSIINLGKFIDQARATVSDFDEAIIIKAWNYAFMAHKGAKRDTGETYFNHSVNVARQLFAVQCDSFTVASALLHDVVEDTNITLEDIEKEFNREIMILVKGVSKLSALDPEKYENLPPEKKRSDNIRKLFVSIVDDPRVAIIKLCDRLHNLATLGGVKEEDRRRRIALESLEIYAPLAEALGLGVIQQRLQDLAFQYLEPDTYQYIEDRIKEKQQDFDDVQSLAVQLIQKSLEKEGINGLVYWRRKEIYSTYKKMVALDLDFEKVYDVIGIRIIVDTEEHCYNAMEVVDQLGVQVRYNDYIQNPRGPLGYKSLHKVLMDVDGPKGQLIEVQIRTNDMHEKAERGSAAHWRYKIGSKQDPSTVKRIDDLRKMLDHLGNTLSRLEDEGNKEISYEEMVNIIRDEGLNSSIVVFTPIDEPKSLPEGSTPLDFAYHIHTELGHECYAAIVNGKNVPLDYELKNGDKVEIIKKKGQTPKLDWIHEGKVKSSEAKQKIRQYVRRQERQQTISFGKDVLQQFLSRDHVKQVTVKDVFDELNNGIFWGENGTIDDLYLAIAEGRISKDRLEKVIGKRVVMKSLKAIGMPADIDKDKANVPKLIHYLENRHNLTSRLREEAFYNSIFKGEISLEMLNDALITLRDMGKQGDLNTYIKISERGVKSSQGGTYLAKCSTCCYPVPGDAIVGYITVGSGISIHRKTCPNVLSSERQKRLIDLDWSSLNLDRANSRTGELILSLLDEDSETYQAMNDAISKKKGVIHGLYPMGSSKRYLYTQVRLLIDVQDIEHLKNIIKELKKIGTIKNVIRSQGD
jgi:GTP diphosphokinase / guanosine-3',5'-bis(diphosphate) 3'-diphosphatase